MSGRGYWMRGGAVLISAAAIGVGAGMLLAPRSGEETRKQLARAAKKAGRQVEDLAGGISGVVDAVEETAGDLVKKGNRIARKARKQFLAVIEEGRDRIARLAA